MRLRNTPVPDPRRFNLTCSSEAFNSGGEECRRHTITPGGPGSTERQAYLSPDPCEKISNYLNIWRIAVSSERPRACRSSLVRCKKVGGEMPLFALKV